MEDLELLQNLELFDNFWKVFITNVITCKRFMSIFGKFSVVAKDLWHYQIDNRGF